MLTASKSAAVEGVRMFRGGSTGDRTSRAIFRGMELMKGGAATGLGTTGMRTIAAADDDQDLNGPSGRKWHGRSSDHRANGPLNHGLS